MINQKKLVISLFLTFLFVSGPIFSDHLVMRTFAQSRQELIEELKQKLQEKEQEYQKLQQEAQGLNQKIQEKQREKKTLANQISILDSQIRKLNLDIRINENKIQQTSLKINKLSYLIGQKTQEIARRKDQLKEALKIIYEIDQETILAMILKNESLSSLLDQIEYIQSIQKGIVENLNQLKTLKQELETEKSQNEILRTELADLNDQLQDRRTIVANRRRDRAELLTETRNQERRYQQLLSEVERKQKAIQKEIFEIEDKLRLLVNPESLPAKGAIFVWPAKGRFTQGYGPTTITGFINDFYSFHNGIDIANGYGTPILAAADGKVSATGNNGRYAYGRWIAIDHQNNLVTLYAHLSQIRVKPGQTVKQGQIIGYMGSTGFSTGSHLHFTVYAKNTFRVEKRWFGPLPMGGSINPLNYLP